MGRNRIAMLAAAMTCFSLGCKSLRHRSAIASASEVQAESRHEDAEEIVDIDVDEGYVSTDLTSLADVDKSAAMVVDSPPHGKRAELGLADPNTRYYVEVFSMQQTSGLFHRLNPPRNTHTWIVATAVDASGQASSFALSYDAADKKIGLFQGRKDGHLLTHQESLELARGKPHVQVRSSGQMEVRPELYTGAVSQYQHIASMQQPGNNHYRITDNQRGRQLFQQGAPGGFINCQHAVADIVVGPNGARERSGVARGFASGDRVVQWYRSNGMVIGR